MPSEMVKHVVIWKLKDEFTDEQKKEHSLRIKNGLEALQGQIEGLLQLEVYINMLDGCIGDIILQSTLTDKEALARYKNHPKHKEAAAAFVAPATQERLAADFEI